MNKKTNISKKYLLFLCLIPLMLALPLLGNGTKTQWKWKVDDLLTPDKVGEYRLSPDGNQLAWTISRWNTKDHKKYNILYLSILESQQTKGNKENKKTEKIRLTRDESTYNNIRWVPGANMISFKTSRKFKGIKPGNLWLMDLAGGEPYPLTSFENGLNRYAWIDKDNLLYTARSQKTLREMEIKESKDTSEVVEDEKHRTITYLYSYNIKTKKMKGLTENSKPLTRFWLSPDKKWVIYTLSMSLHFSFDQKVSPRHYLMNLGSGETREIFSDSPSKMRGRFTWSRDGKGFYAGKIHSSLPRFRFASVSTQCWYSLETHRHVDVDLEWKRYGGTPVITSNGFLMALPNGVHYAYARYVRKGQTWKQQFIEGDLQKNIRNLQMAEQGNNMIYSYSSASRPPRFYLAQLKGNRFVKKQEVMDIKHPHWDKPLAKSEIIHWKGAKDEMVEGILYYPYKYREGEKYPLLLFIHGGPAACDMDSYADRWSYPAHLYAERGAFILKVNYHGSSNYGLEWLESIIGHYYEFEIPDIEKGVDYLIQQGKVDKNKLGIIGWSNGSILGTGLLVHTGRYKVASLGAGDVNWVSDYGNCAFGPAFDELYFRGPPWKKVEHYIKKSFIFEMEKITTPTLIFHGTKDTSVPYEQSKQYFRALQQIGKAPVRFVSFPGAGHGLRKLAHLRRKLTEEIFWFEKFLFKTYKEKNGALKKGSPLDRLKKIQAIARVNDVYGIEKKGRLLPEVVAYNQLMTGRFEVTCAQWAAFDKTYRLEAGKENYPVTGISFRRAGEYVRWLSKLTGNTYRLPVKGEEKTLYGSRSGNIFDYWAGYGVGPGDYVKLLKEVETFGEKAVLLKPAGSFPGTGDEPVFDLDGNAAEWVELEDGKGKACGGAALLPKDNPSEIEVPLHYTGFRVIQEQH